MPLVSAAANVNTYSENLDPYNVSWDMGKNIYFAETFPLAEGSRLFRTSFLLCAQTPFDDWHYSIRATDGAGKPLSVDLHMRNRTSTNSPVCVAHRPGWQSMDWPFDYYPAGTYALVIGRPGSPDTQRAKIHGITPATTTAAHKTWRSLDYGVTWTEIANTELNHAVYGYKPPPDPPPPAAIGNWYITNVVQTVTATGYRIVVTTNVPAHLFFRWTLAPPGQHIKTVMERGAPVQKIIDQCFVATNDINQLEDGDTLVHTFLVEPWPVCETRWFYFWGTRIMYRQPSVSPIYEKHRTAPALVLQCWIHTPPSNTTGATTCVDYSVAFKPCNSFTPKQVAFWWRLHPTQPQPPWIAFKLFTAAANGQPITLLFTSASYLFPTLTGNLTQYTFDLTGWPTVLAGQNYAIAFFAPDVYTGFNKSWTRGLGATIGPCTLGILPRYYRWYRWWAKTLGLPCTTPISAWININASPDVFDLTGTPL